MSQNLCFADKAILKGKGMAYMHLLENKKSMKINKLSIQETIEKPFKIPRKYYNEINTKIESNEIQKKMQLISEIVFQEIKEDGSGK